MTYIIKTMNDGRVGVYDTVRGCFPIAGAELREAGIKRIEGSGKHGWFTKAELPEAEAIVAKLNDYYGYEEGSEAKVTKPKAKAKTTPKDDDLATIGASLIADQAGV